jgi:hypothetical protein
VEIVYIYTIVKDKEIMTVQINFKPLVLAILTLIIAVMTVNGTTQQFIPFADPLNEMIFAAGAFTASIFSLAASFSKIDK